MTTATATKKPKSLVTTKLTAGGKLSVVVSHSVHDQIVRAHDLCYALAAVPQLQTEAQAAKEALAALMATEPMENEK